MSTLGHRDMYLDNNATTQPLPEVVEAIASCLRDTWGNPSSAHSLGTSARALIEEARESVAMLVGTLEEQVVFTGSGTEANNQVLRSIRSVDGEKVRIITSAIEHASVIRTCEALAAEGLVDLDIVSVDHSGVVRLDAIEKALERPADLVSIQWVNNETGVIQPVHDIEKLCRKIGVFFHTDAAQAIGKIEMDAEAAEFDFVTVTAHKIHGPKGVGAVCAANTKWLTPVITGGAQESGLRAGTMSVACLIGFGVAADIRVSHMDEVVSRMARLRDNLEDGILAAIPDASINGGGVARVCNTTDVLFRGVDGDAMIARLDQLGVACSQGSACTSMSPEPSHVLVAMGLSKRDAYSSIRFAVSEMTTDDEVASAVDAIASAYRQLRSVTGKSS